MGGPKIVVEFRSFSPKRNETVLALACFTPWSARFCGYLGASDGWQDLHTHQRVTWRYAKACDGNGHKAESEGMLGVMGIQTSAGGLRPEQVAIPVVQGCRWSGRIRSI